MNWTIEKAKPEDAAEVLDYMKQIGSESDNLTYDGKGLPLTIAEEAEMIEQTAASANSVMLAARVEGKIVGLTNLAGGNRRLGQRGEIGISVLKEYWHQGLGSALLTAVMTQAKEDLGMTLIFLEVRSDNLPAIKLYKKFGFNHFGTLHDSFKVGEKYFDTDWMVAYL